MPGTENGLDAISSTPHISVSCVQSMVYGLVDKRDLSAPGAVSLWMCWGHSASLAGTS